MPVTVVSSWDNSLTGSSGFAVPPPATRSLQVPVANSGTPGNWLIAFCGWRQPAGYMTTVAVGDTGGSRWEPLGVPAGTSPPAGNVRCSVWYTLSPAAVTGVLVAPDDYATSLAAVILEVSGLSAWDTLTAVVTQFANASTTLTAMSPGAPASQALLLTACVSDNNADTITGPGGGWTAAPTSIASNGTDHTQDLTLTPAYQVTSSAVTATFSSSGSQDLAGVTAGLLVTGTAPAAPSQSWPLVRLQAAFGSGAATPWDQYSWTDLTSRYLGMSSSRGKQYELDTIQSGTVNWTLAGNDGALTPGYSGSPFFPDVLVCTPVRLLVTWPPPPSASARTYCVTRGFFERWPSSLTAARYQLANAVSTDAWALLTPLMLTIARSEMLVDNPYGCWPCSDPAGSVTASDIAGAGASQLQVVTSKYGAGTAVQAFGADAAQLAGDPSATGWSQTLVPAVGNMGYCLYYADPDLPPLAAGITIEAWFNALASQPTGTNLAIITVTQPRGIMAQVYIQQSTGHLLIDIYNATTRAKATATISSNNWLGANWTHLALTLTPTTWGAYVDGGSFAATGGSAVFASTGYWLEWGGTADRLSTAGFSNTSFAELVIYPRVLTQVRVISHYWGTLTGFYGEDDAGTRIDRLLGDAGCAFPRVLPSGGYSMVAASDIDGQAVQQNIVNIAESDSGLLLVSGNGYITYLPRGSQWNLPVLWTLGEDQPEPLNANWSFETSVAPWAGQDGATLTQSGTWSSQGAFSALFHGNGTTANPQIVSEQTIPVTAGSSYTATAVLYSPQGWGAVQILINWWTAAGGYISTSAIGTSALPAGITAGTFFDIPAETAPPTAVFAQVIIQMTGTPASTVQCFADLAMLTANSVEFAYLADFGTDCDPSQVFDDVTLEQLATVATVGAAASGVTVVVADQALIAQYGDQTLQETVYLTDVGGITDLANWIVQTTGTPQNRVAQLTLDPAANPALWPVALAAETGQVVTVNRRLAGTQLVITGQFQIMTVSHANSPGAWKTTLTLVPYTGQVLTADDPVLGQLTGSNRLGW